MNIFSGSILYYVIISVLLLFSAATAYLIYRKEDLENYKKAILVSLRTLSLFLILFLLINPFTEYLKKSVSRPVNAVLIDNSLSTKLENRFTMIPEAVNLLGTENLHFVFGSKLLKKEKEYIYDTSLYYKYSTNLSAALDDIGSFGDLQINSFTVVSDGQINEGNNLLNTVMRFKVPFHYILSGDTVQKKDFVLRSVNYNKSIFVNSLSKIFVTVNSFGYDKDIKVNLYEDGNKVKTNIIKTGKDVKDYSTSFDIISTNQGIKKYKAEIEPEEDEITKANNSEVFYVKYVDNSIKVLVIAGSPSYDLSSLKQAFNRTDNFKTDFRIQKHRDEYYDGDIPDLKNYNVLILNGFPTEITSEEQINKLKKSLKDFSIPVIFINSSDVSFDKLRELQSFLPFIVNDISKKEFKSNIRITQNTVSEKAEMLNKFNVYPQSYFYKEAFSVKPNSTVLGLTAQFSEPAIVSDNTSGTKSAGFLGYGYFKWNLNVQGNYNFLQGLLSAMINLTVDENSNERFVLRTNKDYYAVSENVLYSAYYRDSDPLKKYEVKVNVSGNGKNEVLKLNQVSGNVHSGEQRIFDNADYKIKGDLYENGIYITSSEIKITVGDAVEEFKDTRAKDDVLKEIAFRTKGQNLSSKSKQEIKEILKSQGEESKTTSVKTLFRRSFLYLILVIVLLSIEWFIRKRSNLI